MRQKTKEGDDAHSGEKDNVSLNKTKSREEDTTIDDDEGNA